MELEPEEVEDEGEVAQAMEEGETPNKTKKRSRKEKEGTTDGSQEEQRKGEDNKGAHDGRSQQPGHLPNQFRQWGEAAQPRGKEVEMPAVRAGVPARTTEDEARDKERRISWLRKELDGMYADKIREAIQEKRASICSLEAVIWNPGEEIDVVPHWKRQKASALVDLEWMKRALETRLRRNKEEAEARKNRLAGIKEWAKRKSIEELKELIYKWMDKLRAKCGEVVQDEVARHQEEDMYEESELLRKLLHEKELGEVAAGTIVDQAASEEIDTRAQQRLEEISRQFTQPAEAARPMVEEMSGMDAFVGMDAVPAPVAAGSEQREAPEERQGEAQREEELPAAQADVVLRATSHVASYDVGHSRCATQGDNSLRRLSSPQVEHFVARKNLVKGVAAELIAKGWLVERDIADDLVIMNAALFGMERALIRNTFTDFRPEELLQSKLARPGDIQRLRRKIIHAIPLCVIESWRRVSQYGGASSLQDLEDRPRKFFPGPKEKPTKLEKTLTGVYGMWSWYAIVVKWLKMNDDMDNESLILEMQMRVEATVKPDMAKMKERSPEEFLEAIKRTVFSDEVIEKAEHFLKHSVMWAPLGMLLPEFEYRFMHVLQTAELRAAYSKGEWAKLYIMALGRVCTSYASMFVGVSFSSMTIGEITQHVMEQRKIRQPNQDELEYQALPAQRKMEVEDFLVNFRKLDPLATEDTGGKVPQFDITRTDSMVRYDAAALREAAHNTYGLNYFATCERCQMMHPTAKHDEVMASMRKGVAAVTALQGMESMQPEEEEEQACLALATIEQQHHNVGKYERQAPQPQVQQQVIDPAMLQSLLWKLDEVLLSQPGRNALRLEDTCFRYLNGRCAAGAACPRAHPQPGVEFDRLRRELQARDATRGRGHGQWRGAQQAPVPAPALMHQQPQQQQQQQQQQSQRAPGAGFQHDHHHHSN